MRDFAKRIGAMRGDRPDWYRVAEALAAISTPELLGDGPMSRGAGRPKTNDDFLAMEVHRTMWAFDVGVDEACRRISRGDKVPLPKGPWRVSAPGDGPPTATRLPGKSATKGSPWAGMKWSTLVRRYKRWKAEEKQRQQKET
jgi:hypothetical protein